MPRYPRVADGAEVTDSGSTYARVAVSPDSGLYVDPAGNDANDGLSPGAPLATLGTALAKLPSGATSRGKVTLLPGTYTLPAGGVSAVTDNVEIEGVGATGQTNLLGTGPGAVTLVVPDGAVGLTLGDATNRFRGPTLRNLHIRANSAASLGGLRLRSYSNWLLERVVCSGFTAGYGIFLDAGGDPGRTMYGNAIECGAHDCLIGFDNWGGSGVTLMGGTFDNGSNNAGTIPPAGSVGVRARGANAQLTVFGARVQSFSTHFDLAGGASSASQIVGCRCEGFDVAVMAGQSGVSVYSGSFNNTLLAAARAVGSTGTAFQATAAASSYRWVPGAVASVANEMVLDAASVGVSINANGSFSSGFTTTFARHQVNSRSATAIAGIYQGFTGQTADILQVRDSGGTAQTGVAKDGTWYTRRTVAPADADVAAGQMFVWFDQTAGAAKLMVKAKDSGGTVRTASVPLA